MIIMEQKNLPRIDGDCLVVPYNHELPRFCVLTGKAENLEQVTERVSSGGCLMLMLLGPIGLLLGWKSARITYYMDRELMKKTGNWRTISLITLLVGLALIAGAYYWQSYLPFISGLVLAMIAVILSRMLGRRIKIANVWEGEVFIRDLPAIFYKLDTLC